MCIRDRAEVAALRAAQGPAGAEAQAALVAAKAATQEYKEKLQKAVKKGKALEQERNRAVETLERLQVKRRVGKLVKSSRRGWPI
eukprot:9325156-Pyramimonas_sp.AAC.1